jgi:hypothetical protein
MHNREGARGRPLHRSARLSRGGVGRKHYWKKALRPKWGILTGYPPLRPSPSPCARCARAAPASSPLTFLTSSSSTERPDLHTQRLLKKVHCSHAKGSPPLRLLAVWSDACFAFVCLSCASCVCLTGLREAHARVAGWVDGRGEPCGSHGFVRRRFRRSVGRSPAGPVRPTRGHPGHARPERSHYPIDQNRSVFSASVSCLRSCVSFVSCSCVCPVLG